MTDTNIIKALECCSVDDVKSCDDCPYYEKETNTYCANDLIKDAFDLIIRQKAENDCLRKELEKLHSHKDFLRAEIERLQAMVDAELDTIHNLGDDYERVLEEENELVKTAKTETIKEFAKRLKEHTTTARFEQGKYSYEIITAQSIDNLVKEMTEVSENE